MRSLATPALAAEVALWVQGAAWRWGRGGPPPAGTPWASNCSTVQCMALPRSLTTATPHPQAAHPTATDCPVSAAQRAPRQGPPSPCQPRSQSLLRRLAAHPSASCPVHPPPKFATPLQHPSPKTLGYGWRVAHAGTFQPPAACTNPSRDIWSSAGRHNREGSSPARLPRLRGGEGRCSPGGGGRSAHSVGSRHRSAHSAACMGPAATVVSSSSRSDGGGGRRRYGGTAAGFGGGAGRDWGDLVPPGRGQTVAVGISGGVDSAVAALILKEQGYKVVGVFMRNWDEGEEVGNQNCSVEQDLRDAQGVCRQLGVPLHEADFVAKYWTRVFEEFMAQCARGLTPNPDLACNRHIKFDALLEFADSLGAHQVATGHYARLRPAPSDTRPPPGPPLPFAPASPQLPGSTDPSASPQLLKGADPLKDQTYFLASVEPSCLHRVMFPVGGLRKGAVREVAAERGLLPAERRSSAGICFIGRRNFADFLTQYVAPLPGTYACVDSGLTLGPCPNILAVTHGQRPGIGGAADRVYVVGKDVVSRTVYVCQGRDHPALLTRTALLRTPHWLSPSHARQLAQQGFLRCQYKARYGQEARDCTLVPLPSPSHPSTGHHLSSTLRPDAPHPPPLHPRALPQKDCALPAHPGAESDAIGASRVVRGGPGFPGEEGTLEGIAVSTAGPAAVLGPQHGSWFEPSRYTRLLPQDSKILPGYLVAVFDSPAPAITPQQAFVAYDGEVCLGTALIAMPGITLHELQGGT